MTLYFFSSLLRTLKKQEIGMTINIPVLVKAFYLRFKKRLNPFELHLQAIR